MDSDFLTPMERALLPRSSEGLINPMTFDNETPKMQLFPCIRPSIDGTVTPMIFEDDFADGKLPENFGYALGHVRPGQKFDGTNWGAICYEDPVLNL